MVRSIQLAIIGGQGKNVSISDRSSAIHCAPSIAVSAHVYLAVIPIPSIELSVVSGHGTDIGPDLCTAIRCAPAIAVSANIYIPDVAIPSIELAVVGDQGPDITPNRSAAIRCAPRTAVNTHVNISID
jgi:hypothetical protein